MLDLNDLRYFVRIVEHGGLAAASRNLQIPKSTLSKRLAALETELEVRLIFRTSRRFSLTDVGRDFYEHASAALMDIESAEGTVRSLHTEPSGTVRVTASVPVAQFLLADHLPSLARRYPKLCIHLHVTDKFVDLVQEGYDIAVRNHWTPLPDSTLISRQVAVEPVWVVASPEYVSVRGLPQHPRELGSHDALLSGANATAWRLQNAFGMELEVTPNVRMTADEGLVLLKAAEAGMGLACLPVSICGGAVQHRRLIRVLPDWIAGEIATTILMPDRRSKLPGVRAVVDFLCEHIGQAVTQ